VRPQPKPVRRNVSSRRTIWVDPDNITIFGDTTLDTDLSRDADASIRDTGIPVRGHFVGTGRTDLVVHSLSLGYEIGLVCLRQIPI